jgi:hypothetical protein
MFSVAGLEYCQKEAIQLSLSITKSRVDESKFLLIGANQKLLNGGRLRLSTFNSQPLLCQLLSSAEYSSVKIL